MPLGNRAVEVRGLKEFGRELKRIDTEMPKAMRKASKAAADLVVPAAQAKAAAGTRTQRRAASAIKARAGVARAAVAVTGSPPFALGAFFGAKRFPQFPPWVGNTWQAGAPDEGPYAVNAAIAEKRDQIINEYAKAVDEITARAFPN